MADHSEDTNPGFFAEFSKWMKLALECNQALVEDAVEQICKPHRQGETFVSGLSSVVQSILSGNPQCISKLIEHQLELINDQLSLIEQMLDRLGGRPAAPLISPTSDDRRFCDAEWASNPFFDFIKQSYLLTSRALDNMVESMDLTDTDREKVGFYVRQLSSALAPTNFPFSNPEVVRQIQASQGENLIKGVEQLIHDRKKSGEFLNICMTDSDSFIVGKNLAHTPGMVVFENELMQLIQYHPSNRQAFDIPLLFIPSWINKYYVFDLQHSNSMVRWALENGLTVFAISWVNPDSRHRHIGFDEKIQRGLLTAVDKIRALTGADAVNCAGYCLGGALLAGAAAYQVHSGDQTIRSATYLATSFDFNDPGEFRVLLDKQLTDSISRSLHLSGVFDGRELAVSFSLLRENELYWNYYILNYLKGERPGAFDILYWNSDSTNVSEKMHNFVVNELIRENLFLCPEGFSVLGQKVKLSDTSIPVYILATERDHIAKWPSCFAGTHLHGGECRFVLAGSGHIAGVINPATRNKYHYYTNSHPIPGCDHAMWLAGAEQHPGSWWQDWLTWLQRNSGKLSPAVTIASAQALEPAPGRYVKRRLDHEQGERSKAPTRAA